MTGLQGATAGGELVLLHRYVVGGEFKTEAGSDLGWCVRRAAVHIIAVGEQLLPVAIQHVRSRYVPPTMFGIGVRVIGLATWYQ